MLDDENQELPPDIADYWLLCISILGWETNSDIVPKEDMELAIEKVYFISVGEHLCREGLCTMTGLQTLENANNVVIKMTPEGQAAFDSVNEKLKKPKTSKNNKKIKK